MRAVTLLLVAALLVAATAVAEAAPRKRCGQRACRGLASSARTHLPAGLVGRLVLPAPAGAVPGPGAPSTVTPGAVAPPPPPPPPPLPESNPRFLSVKSDDAEANNWHLYLSRSSVLAGAVTVDFNNRNAADPHDLRFRRGASTVFSVPELAAGESRDTVFAMTKGTYTVFCGLPGHEAAGMKAQLTVE